MFYVIEYMNKSNEVKYYLTDSAGVYCPEIATRYSSKKSALTVIENIKKKGLTQYSCLNVKELSYDIMSAAYRRYSTVADFMLYPSNYR